MELDHAAQFAIEMRQAAWRERAERELLRAIEFASQNRVTWDWWPCDWCEEAVRLANALAHDARVSGRLEMRHRHVA